MILFVLTLYQLRGGQKAPDDHKALCRVRRAGARLTKILDFVPFNTWQVPEKPFLKFVFQNFAKLNVKNFRGSSSIRWKIRKSKKNLIFCKKSYFFWLNLYCTCSQLSFEVYMTSVAQNLKFRPFLTWKIWFLTFVIWQPVAAKLSFIEGCFWCLWNAKDQNIYPGTSFGHQEVSGPTYKAVNTSGAFWPPPVDNVIPEPRWNRVKKN